MDNQQANEEKGALLLELEHIAKKIADFNDKQESEEAYISFYCVSMAHRHVSELVEDHSQCLTYMAYMGNPQDVHALMCLTAENDNKLKSVFINVFFNLGMDGGIAIIPLNEE